MQLSESDELCHKENHMNLASAQTLFYVTLSVEMMRMMYKAKRQTSHGAHMRHFWEVSGSKAWAVQMQIPYQKSPDKL